MTDKITYRSDIDGLRAVAVLGVLFFHSGLGISGGFVGVDIFFVISGFLITSLIAKDLRLGRFSFIQFWERRIRRIVPALFVMIFTVMLVGWFGMFPEIYQKLAVQIIATIFCVSNVKFWREDGYFDLSSDEKPLLHTWSLSVEEQFYFFIPIIFFLIFKYKKQNWMIVLITIICLVSFVISIYASYKHPSANFYLIPTRAWELGIGSLLAFVKPIENRIIKELLALVGFFLLLIANFYFAPKIRFPGASALLPVLGTAFFIWAGSGEKKLPLINLIISFRPFIWIGLISYSLYLWHWPIFAYQKLLGYSSENQKIQLFLVLLSFIPAWFSWKFVENPFRKKMICSNQKSMIFTGVTIAFLFISLSITVLLTKGAFFRISTHNQSKYQQTERNKFMGTGDKLEYKISNLNSSYIGSLKSDKKCDFIFHGDSHAYMLGAVFDEQAKDLNLKGVICTHPAHIPLLGLDESHHVNQFPMTDVVDKNLDMKPATVFLLAYWSLYVEGYPLFKKNKDSIFIKRKEVASYSSEESTLAFRYGLSETLKKYSEHGISVVVIKDVPTQNGNIGFSYKNKLINLPLINDKIIPRLSGKDHLKKQALVNSIIDELVLKFPNATSVDASHPFFINGNFCKTGDDDGCYYRDEDHLNDFGAKKVLGSSVKKWLQKSFILDKS